MMFKVGDAVEDKTAVYHGWDDKQGVVIDVDGPHVKVRYVSNNERWKMYISLRLLPTADEHEKARRGQKEETA
jgi:hypothetical protein